MGTVYRAVRDDDQFQKEVAIKVVKRGMDLDAVVRRFRRERQILARLEHPNIARLIDGGATEDGRPYFVMEYVEGRPLADFCGDKPLKERLLLFRQVCAGVQYAHQNLIVHRDLKPANILITKDGVPKLLDFGLAKVLSPDELPEQTYTFVRMLTPDYASPEQVRGEAVTTASDIYSLGAILYELVSGRHAYQFKNRTTAEMERVICRQDPPPLAGELGSIAQMAMHKEPLRRYATVEQLSEDVRRYLEGLPVLARKDTILYTAGKFLRRNRFAVAAALFAWVALATGAGVAWRQARKAERGYRQAREYANSILTSALDKTRMLPGTLPANEDLARKSLVYFQEAAKERPADAHALLDLAIGYFRLAQVHFLVGQPSLQEFEKALEVSQKALDIVEPLYRRDPNRPELIAFLASLYNYRMHCFAGLGRYVEARQSRERAQLFIDRSVAEAYQRIGYPSLRSFLNEVTLAMVKFWFGDYRGALQYLEPVSHVRTRSVQGGRAEALKRIGDLEQARRIISEQLSVNEHVRENFLTRQARILLLSALARIEGDPLSLNLGLYKAGLSRVHEAVAESEILRRQDEGDPSAVVMVAAMRKRLAGFLRETASAEALAEYSNARKLYTEVLQRTPSNLVFKRALADIDAESALPLRKIGNYGEALAALNRALEAEKEMPDRRSFYRLELGDYYLSQGQRECAGAEYQSAVALAESAVKAMPQDMDRRRELADAYERLGAMYGAAGDRRIARDWYTKSLDVWNNWTKWGVSSVYDQGRRNQAARAVARYGRLDSANSPE